MTNLYSSKISSNGIQPDIWCPCSGGCFLGCTGNCNWTCSGSCAGNCASSAS